MHCRGSASPGSPTCARASASSSRSTDLTDERLAEIHEIAEKLLSNPVIEDFTVHVEGQA